MNVLNPYPLGKASTLAGAQMIAQPVANVASDKSGVYIVALKKGFKVWLYMENRKPLSTDGVIRVERNVNRRKLCKST
jgi:hypothetical protein